MEIGYMAIIALLGMSEESRALICQEFIRKLQTWYLHYVDLFYTEEGLFVNSDPIAPMRSGCPFLTWVM